MRVPVSAHIFLRDGFVHEKCLCHRGRVGDPSCFDDEPIKSFPLGEFGEDLDQISADAAADTPIIHFDDLFVCFLNGKGNGGGSSSASWLRAAAAAAAALARIESRQRANRGSCIGALANERHT